jgi:hypothetical protein
MALWRFTVYTNYLLTRNEFYFDKDKKYALVVFEVDHSLADGFSLIKLLYRLCGKIFTMTETTKDSFKDNLLIRHFYLVGLFIFRFPYEFGRYLLNSNLFQSHWPERNIFSGERRNYFGSVSSLMPFQKIREVRNPK